MNVGAVSRACAVVLLGGFVASCAPPRPRAFPVRPVAQRLEFEFAPTAAKAAAPIEAAAAMVASTDPAPEREVAALPIPAPAAEAPPVPAPAAEAPPIPAPVAEADSEPDPEKDTPAPPISAPAAEAPSIPAPAAEPVPVAVAAGSAAASALPWPRLSVFELALQAFRCGEQEGRFRRPVLTVIDYSLPATEPRLWVIDLPEGRVLHHELVAHGEQSGENLAVSFSNGMNSHKSSIGLFRTDEIYSGQFGYSLRLSGLEPGINDNARARSIVFHGSSDVSPEFAAEWGTIGRSWGCPALPEHASAQVIDCIAGGSAVFA